MHKLLGYWPCIALSQVSDCIHLYKPVTVISFPIYSTQVVNMVELIKNTVNNNSKVVNTLQKTIYSTTFRNQTPLILETSLTLALNVSEMVFHMSEFPCVCGGGGGGGWILFC